MARRFVMRAKDSVTAAMFTWLATSADFAAAGYPGPNAATNTYVASYYDDAASLPSAPANPGDDGKIVYASAGQFITSSTVKVTNSGAGLSFGSNPAGYSGATVMAWSSDNRLAGRSTGGSSVSLFHWTASDRINIGSSTIITGFDLSSGTGSFSFFTNSGTTAFTVGSALNLFFGASTVASAGTVRGPATFSVQCRDAANSANISLIALNGADRIDVGSGTAAGNLVFNASGAAQFVWSFGGTFTARMLTGGELRLGDVNTATGAMINVKNGVSIIEARNFANAGDLLVASTSTDDTVRFGNDTGVAGIHLRTGTGSIRGFVGGTEVINLSSTIADFKSLELRFGTNPATGAKINVPNNVSIVEFRNAANSADVAALGTDGSDQLYVGGGAGPAQIRLQAIGNTRIYVNSNLRYDFGDATLGLTNVAINAANIVDPSAPSAGNARLYAINGQWRSKDAVSAREDLTFTDLGGTSNFAPANGQVIKRKLRTNTTSAATVTLDSFTLPDNSIVQAEAWVRARDRTTGDSAWYVVRAGAKRNGGGAAALVGAMAFSSSGEDDATWGPVLDANTNDLRLRFVGDGTNIVDVEAHWSIYVSAL